MQLFVTPALESECSLQAPRSQLPKGGATQVQICLGHTILKSTQDIGIFSLYLTFILSFDSSGDLEGPCHQSHCTCGGTQACGTETQVCHSMMCLSTNRRQNKAGTWKSSESPGLKAQRQTGALRSWGLPLCSPQCLYLSLHTHGTFGHHTGLLRDGVIYSSSSSLYAFRLPRLWHGMCDSLPVGLG